MIPTRKRLVYALGFLELELFAEARAELAHIPAEELTAPAVMAVSLEIAMGDHDWAQVIELAPLLSAATPSAERPWIAWAYALRELQRVEDALSVLLRGETVIVEGSVVVDYNLACYFCLLGDLREARRRLARVYRREPAWKKDAAKDPDLAALHASLP